MDSLFHFVFAFIAGMAVNVKLDHEPMWVAVVALSAVLIDIDHLLFLAGVLPFPRTFHALLFTVAAPLLLFYAAYLYERGTDSITYQSLSLLLLVMMIGHVTADLFNEGAIRLFYPFTGTAFTAPQVTVSVVKEGWHVVTPESIVLALYGGIIGLAYYAEEFIYFFEEKHETVGNAVRDAFKA
ncbi:MAG: metal-dependent hydrolase [Candidatus Nanohaloarchaea archaeon]|nr:metal-dependent hydrolase [Candidatus Nanohaloarchaea archaeon]